MDKIKLFIFLVFASFVLAFGANADTLGQGQQFFISSQYDAQSRSAVNATLRQVSEYAYFYIADEYWNGISASSRNQALNQVDSLAREFDQRIYPTEVQFFGSEPNPGIDGDPRVIILLVPLIENAGGYFDTANQYSRVEVPSSNQREMIYLNVNQLADQSKMFAFLAHEFQHLISFNQKENLRNVSDDIWLNELRSEYAPTLLGYNDIYEGSHLKRRADALIENPSDSLTEWKNLSADYGQIGMFGEYIAERWSPQVIADTLKNKSIGFNSLAESLVSNGFGDTFLDIFRNWLIANFLNDTSTDIRLGYSKTSLAGIHVPPTRVINNLGEGITSVVSDSIKDWQGKWYDISQLAAGQKNILKINFSSPSLTSFYISYLVFKPDGRYQVYAFNPTPGFETLYIPSIGTDVNRVVLMPIKKDKFSGFSANETPVQLTISFERSYSTLPVTAILHPVATPTPAIPTTGYSLPASPKLQRGEPATHYPDGSLIRVRGGYKVYVISAKGGSASGGKGLWRRHIISPKIFNFYPGLGFNKVLEVDPSVLDQYQESDLIRYADGQRVYAIDVLGTRRWLNMSGDQFIASGRVWDSIFEVNLPELTFYSTGVNIIK